MSNAIACQARWSWPISSNPARSRAIIARRFAVRHPATSSLSDGDAIVRFVRDLRAAWAAGGEWERTKLVASVYDRVVVNDREVVEVELTDDAKRHGLAWALPEEVRVALARPAGVGRSLTRQGIRIPIVGRREWEAAARESA